jgi:phage tail-like protein
MAKFTVNPHRLDPYSNYKFRVKWDGRYVAGVSKISGLKRMSEVFEYRDGGDISIIHKIPGRTRFAPIILERGVTHDDEFEKWANKVWDYGAGPESEVSLKDFRKDIIIDLFNEAGQKVLSYIVYRCWVSEYQALPDLDSNEPTVAIESIKIECEGWERDKAVTEPSEPSLD